MNIVPISEILGPYTGTIQVFGIGLCVGVFLTWGLFSIKNFLDKWV
jgi:hypothetical protein